MQTEKDEGAPLTGGPVDRSVRPVAWAVFAPNGNIRMWSQDPAPVRKLADDEGLPLVPLYAGKEIPKARTKKQVEQAFRAELQALLDKYGAEMEAKYHYQGYAEFREDVRMTVDIPGVWDKDGEPVREYTEIDLGCHLWPTPKPEKTKGGLSDAIKAARGGDAPVQFKGYA